MELEQLGSKLGFSIMKAKGPQGDAVTEAFAEFVAKLDEMGFSLGCGREAFSDSDIASYIAVKNDLTDELLLAIIIPENQE